MIQQWRRKWVLLLCFALVMCAAQNGVAGPVWEGVVTRVIDGDSLTIKRGRRPVPVRLYGVDSPEHGQACWREAKNAARAFVLGKTVRVESMARDRYDRVVALVDFRGQSLNAAMVERGLAWVYRQYCTAQPLCSRLDALEKTAKSGRLGIWREQRPMPPWVWRRHNK